MTGDAPVRFRGTPTSLAALVGAAAQVAPEHPIRLAVPEKAVLSGGRELRALAAGDDGVLRLHLPRATPPGTYQATMALAGEEREVEITVEPEVFLRFFPERLILSAAAGEHVPVSLTLLNLGNVSVELRGAYAFGLFDVGGVERAIARMVGAHEGARRIDVFTDAVAEEHGGMVRIKVESGEGELPPGESRELRLSLHVPPGLREGHSYWGTWPLYNVRYYVRITGRSGSAGGVGAAPGEAVP
jgi:hypothetical protein